MKRISLRISLLDGMTDEFEYKSSSLWNNERKEGSCGPQRGRRHSPDNGKKKKEEVQDAGQGTNGLAGCRSFLSLGLGLSGVIIGDTFRSCRRSKNKDGRRHKQKTDFEFGIFSVFKDTFQSRNNTKHIYAPAATAALNASATA